MNTATSPSRAALAAAFAVLYVVWGSTYLGIAVAIETIPPFLMAGVRFLVAGSILYVWARRRGTPAPTRSQWIAGAIGGALLMGGGNGIVTWAEQTVPSGATALMVATMTLWVTLLDWIVLRGPRPPALVGLGIATGLGGVALLVGGGVKAPLPSLALLLVSSLSWSIGTLHGRRGGLPGSPILASAVLMLTGGVLLTLVSGVAGEWGRFDPRAVSLASFVAWGGLVLFGSVLAFSCYVFLVRNATPTAAATYVFVNPVVAVVLGSVFLDEPFTPRTAVAAALIVVAVVLVLRGRRRATVDGGRGDG